MEYVIATRAVRNRRSFRSAIDAQGSPHGSLLCRACMRETRGTGTTRRDLRRLSLMRSLTSRPLMRSLDVPSVDAISGWFGS
jgi:hypothetical protein